MNTKPTVSRFVDRAKVEIPPNTLAKANEEGDAYKYTCISRSGHYACDHSDTTHIIIEKDGKIGCSCGDMTYRCTGNNVCKHIARFIDLEVPPQIPASEELIRKLTLMGWIGGRDNLHPAELLRTPPDESDKDDDAAPEVAMEHYECPKCGDVVDIEADKLRDWKLKHIDVCPGKKATETPAVNETPEKVEAVAPLVPEVETPPHTMENLDYVALPTNAISRNLAAALCNMQKIDLLAVTDSDNPFHNAKYADLASVWAAIRKPLTDNGLAVIQTTEPYKDGITVVTTLLHTSGEAFTARLSCEVPKSKPDKNGQIKPNVQGLGSTITYLRRYSLAAMVGVAPIDDDGEAAMGREDKR